MPTHDSKLPPIFLFQVKTLALLESHDLAFPLRLMNRPDAHAAAAVETFVRDSFVMSHMPRTLLKL